MARVPEDATAFPNRDAAHDINIVGVVAARGAADADRHIAWVRGSSPRSNPTAGASTSTSPATTPPNVSGARTSDEQWLRLTALKAKYDPTNFFRMNANIPPNGS